MTETKTGFYGDIIGCYNRLYPDPLYIGEVSRMVNRSGAMLHRYLCELVQRGVLEQVPTPPGRLTRRRGGAERSYYALTPVGRRMNGLVHVPRFAYLDGPCALTLGRVTVQMLRLMHLVAPRPVGRVDLAQVLGMPDGSARDVIYRLEKVGVAVPQDHSARPHRLMLTEAGARLAAECATPGIPLTTFPQPFRRGT